MNFYKRKRRTPTVIIVSLIDIFAILLIFVIVTTTFKRVQPSVTIKLPEVNSADGKAQGGQEPVILSVAENEEIKLDAQSVTLETLEPELRKLATQGRRVALNADKKAPFGVIVQVLQALKRSDAGAGDGTVSAFTEIQKKGH